MSDEGLKIYGPYELEFKFHITDGESSGVVTYSSGVGAKLNKELADEATHKIQDVLDEMGDGWRFATKSETINNILGERYNTNERFAVPGGSDFDSYEGES